MLTRTTVLAALRAALEPLTFINAMWEGGAAAWRRVDEFSDIDLQLDVEDGRVADAVEAVEHALGELGGIDLRYEIPRPTWHGHFQTFYRLRDASPFLLLDLVVIEHANPNKFLEPERHGRLVIHFDRCGVVHQEPMDRDALAAAVRRRMSELRTSVDMFAVMPFKELERGNTIEAIAFYQSMLLRPLLEALRILHVPERSGFHTRYVHYDLPHDVVRRLESFFSVAGAEALRSRATEARTWFDEVARSIDDSFDVHDRRPS